MDRNEALGLPADDEQVATADASAGWCVMISATSAYKSGSVDHETGREVYGDLNGIYGGVFAPMGRAVAEGDGYRLSVDGPGQAAAPTAVGCPAARSSGKVMESQNCPMVHRTHG